MFYGWALPCARGKPSSTCTHLVVGHMPKLVAAKGGPWQGGSAMCQLCRVLHQGTFAHVCMGQHPPAGLKCALDAPACDMLHSACFAQLLPARPANTWHKQWPTVSRCASELSIDSDLSCLLQPKNFSPHCTIQSSFIWSCPANHSPCA